MKDSDIPHRTKLREEIILKADEAIKRLKAHFKVGFLSFNIYSVTK